MTDQLPTPEYTESVQIRAHAVYTFPTDEEHRIIGRAWYRTGLPDVVVTTVALHLTTAGGTPDHWTDRRFGEIGTVKGRLILKNGKLGTQDVDVALSASWQEDPDDPRLPRVKALVDQCWAEFAARAGEPIDVVDRLVDV